MKLCQILSRILVAMLAVSFFMPVMPTQALDQGPSPADQVFEWWNSKWSFRQTVVVTDPCTAKRQQVPVLLVLDIPHGRSLSTLNELRIVDERRTVINSTVIHETFEGIFVRKTYVLFFPDFSTAKKRVYTIYYGNPSATSELQWNDLPNRLERGRTGPIVAKTMGSDVLKLDIPFPTIMYQGKVDVAYQGTYGLSLLSKLSYSGMMQDYGPAEIASSPMRLRDLWLSPYSGSFEGSVGFALFEAGSLRLLRVLVVEGKDMWVLDTIINERSEAIAEVAYLDLIDTSSMSRLGYVTGYYDPGEQIEIMEVGGSVMGFKADQTPYAYEVGPVGSVYAHSQSSNLANLNGQGGSLGLALEWKVDGLDPYDHLTLARYWSAETNEEATVEALGLMRLPTVEFLKDEALMKLPSQVESIYLSTIKYQNLSVPQGGIRFNSTMQSGLKWIASSVRLDGRVVYALPGGGVWKAETRVQKPDPKLHSVTDSEIYASANFWSEEKQMRIININIRDNNSEWGTFTSLSFASPETTVVGASKAVLRLTYKAETGILEGDSDGASLRVALKVDRNFDGVAEEQYVLPVENTRSMVGEVPVATLSSDGLWHTIEVDLTEQISSATFSFQIEITGRTESKFRGRVGLQIEKIYMELEGSASDVLRSTMNSLTPEIQITYAFPGLSGQPLFSRADITLSFLTFDVGKMTPLDPGCFVSTLSAPSAAGAAASANSSKLNIAIQEVADPAILVYNSFGDHLRRIVVNGVALQDGSYRQINSVVYVLKAPLKGALNSSTNYDLKMEFNYATLHARILDPSGEPVPEATATLYDVFRNALAEGVSDDGGEIVFHAVPSTYVIRAKYQGVEVSAQLLSVDSDLNLPISVRVYPIVFKVVDRAGEPIENARVQVLKAGELVEDQYSDAGGQVSAEVVAWKPYTVKVQFEGVDYLSREVKAGTYGSTLELKVDFTKVTPESNLILFATIFLGILPASIIMGRLRGRTS